MDERRNERRGDPGDVASPGSGAIGLMAPEADLAVASFGLSRSFGNVKAVIDVDLRIERGSDADRRHARHVPP